MDGKVIGRINCTLANWTELAFKVPRTHLYKCKENDEIVDDCLTKSRIINRISYATSFILGMHSYYMIYII